MRIDTYSNRVEIFFEHTDTVDEKGIVLHLISFLASLISSLQKDK